MRSLGSGSRKSEALSLFEYLGTIVEFKEPLKVPFYTITQTSDGNFVRTRKRVKRGKTSYVMIERG